jgi:hypothetical protein
MRSELSLPGTFAFLSPVTQQQLQVPVPTALSLGTQQSSPMNSATLGQHPFHYSILMAISYEMSIPPVT